jgi:hypothetical protein
MKTLSLVIALNLVTAFTISLAHAEDLVPNGVSRTGNSAKCPWASLPDNEPQLDALAAHGALTPANENEVANIMKKGARK